jgi:hypothetical protein
MIVLTKKSDLQHILDRIIPAYGKYLDVLPGWYGIILELDKQIAEIDPDYSIAQIKEKFGGLRYNVESSNNFEAIQPLIREAEDQAAKTCERCGAPAELRKRRSWLVTECYDCLPADKAETAYYPSMSWGLTS